MLVKVGSQAGSHSVADSPLQNQLIQVNAKVQWISALQLTVPPGGAPLSAAVSTPARLDHA